MKDTGFRLKRQFEKELVDLWVQHGVRSILATPNQAADTNTADQAFYTQLYNLYLSRLQMLVDNACV
jgi:hypothetical protein